MEIHVYLFEFLPALAFVLYTRQDKGINKHNSTILALIQFIDSTAFYLRGRVERIHSQESFYTVPIGTDLNQLRSVQ
jgi:hypothetical protein